jgi:hypothetical protein
MNVEISIRLTRATAETALWQFWKSKFAPMREVLITACFLVCLVVFGFVQQAVWGTLIIGIWILAFWPIRLWLYFRLRRSWRKQIPDEANFRIRITDLSLTVERQKGRWERPWSGVAEVAKLAHVLILVWSNNGGLALLPLDQLDTDVVAFVLEKTSQPPIIKT